MCGRFSQATSLDELAEIYGFDPGDLSLEERYNVAPMQYAPVMVLRDKRELKMMKWGLVPHWAKDTSIGNKMINARAETLSEKPSFRNAFKKRRCAVLVDGFYEWFKEDGEKKKTPVRIVRKDRRPFALAGLWEKWTKGNELLETFTIVTARPNDLVAKVHHRMAVILPDEKIDQWLDPQNEDVAQLQDLLVPYPSNLLEMYPVSTAVNSPTNDRVEVIEQQGDLFS